MTAKKMSVIFDLAILLLAIYLKDKIHRDIHTEIFITSCESRSKPTEHAL